MQRLIGVIGFALTVLVIALLLGSVALAAGPRIVDDPVSYVLQLEDNSYLTFNAPKHYFQIGKNEVDGHPAVRQGFGIGFYVCVSPNARGIEAVIYIEILGQDKTKLKDWATEYKTQLAETIKTRAGILDTAEDPAKVKFLGREAYTIAYTSHPGNAQNRTVSPCICRAWVLDIEGIRVIVSSEALREKLDPSSGLEKMLSWSKKAPGSGPHLYKLLDITHAVYRYMTFIVPGNTTPIYDNGVMGCAAAWLILNLKGERIGILKLTLTPIGDDKVSDHAKKEDGWVKYRDNFLEHRDKEHLVTRAVSGSAQMLWAWTVTTLASKEQEALKESDAAAFQAALAPAEESNVALFHDVLGTISTWAVEK